MTVDCWRFEEFQWQNNGAGVDGNLSVPWASILMAILFAMEDGEWAFILKR